MRERQAVSPGVVIIAVTVALLALACSITQGAGFLTRGATTDAQWWLFAAISTAIIIGSAVIARLAGGLVAIGASGGVIALCFVTIAGSESFSVGTSAAGLRAGLADAERHETQTSPEYIRAQQVADAYMRQAEELQRRGEQLPIGYATRSAGMQDEAQQALERAWAAQRHADGLDVSSTGKALDAIEDKTGLAPEHLTLLGALLLSLIPATVMLSLGVLAGTNARRGGDDAPGK